MHEIEALPPLRLDHPGKHIGSSFHNLVESHPPFRTYKDRHHFLIHVKLIESSMDNFQDPIPVV